jgi:glycosyltransferase involved in cell wall biosynthesis
MSKKRILTISPFYLPYEATGPVQTIRNMVSALGEDYQFYVVTSDSGRSGSDIHVHNGRSWKEVEGAKVAYIQREESTIIKIISIIKNTDHDIIYINTFFSFLYSLVPIITNFIFRSSPKPVVLAPRGQFSEGAISINGFVKQVYVHLFRITGLHRWLVWQASAETEKQDIVRTMGENVKTIVARDLPSKPSTKESPEWKAKQRKKLNILFLSRIDQKKNIKYALKILKDIKLSVVFNIVGPVSDSRYWSECKSIIKTMPNNIDISYKGSVDHSDVKSVMASHDLFFFPTKGENYGHVIQEALSVGTPVLISDQTPWQDLESAGVGWDVPLSTPERFREVIEQCHAKSEEEYWEWRHQILEWERKRREQDRAVEKNRKLFEKAIQLHSQ